MGRRIIHKLRSAPLAALALAVAMAVAMAAGCGSSSGGSAASATGSRAASTQITVTDDVGKPVTLASPAARVVSTAPADTEIAFALGAGGKLAAGTTYDDYPAAARALPKIGDFQNPSVERIVAFKPDLVLATSGIQAKLRDKLESLGIQVYVVDPTTLDALYTDLTNLGQLMGTQDQTRQVVDGMKATAAGIEQKIAAAKSQAGYTTPKTLLEIWGKPLMVAGKGTLIDDLITLAGGQNVGDAAGSGFPTFSTEVLLQQDPTVYIATVGSQSTPGQIAQRPGYSALTAVKQGHVYTIEDNLVVRPGPRIIEGLQQFAQMIHPELFGTPAPSASATP
jgi:cobalamin transport system substrate-binding protein